ncbi:response regulator transcription factor [Rheinheimera aquimaris]|jgi:DNA-binding response OmpR family regulator|uniref:response regulator transcription factor n=1 Tax=Rheinheimera aquimaris TaxID=412437 RepID=UPI000E7E0D9C|nr:response regulator transcription factor [Rheinheimera aquimaris]HBN89996.1 DNA-binding response regulator [Rheinheimera sp.]|tara:strand:+ start:511 stop:1206 length:696 start_codon:yes stop_codon:yes gene_type:complete
MTSSLVIYVEDDASIADITSRYLRQAGLQVQHFSSAVAAARALQNLPCDLAVLDINLPDGSGLDLLQQAVECNIATLMVTARVSEAQRIEGLQLGADDYLCKPYSPKELTLRVQALLRRCNSGSQQSQWQFDGMLLDLSAQQVWLDGAQLSLTPSEFALLKTLAQQPMRVFSRAALLDAVWPQQHEVTERSVDTHMVNLRKKLGEQRSNPRFIQTRHGAGYQFIGRRSDDT